MNAKSEKASSKTYSISLCICTMNRPDDLSRCLESVFQSVEKPDEVIVSDDSPDPQPTTTVVAKYPDVTYQHGPRRGLGPNRNACIRRASGTHIIFIDDDVCVPPEFFSVARSLLVSSKPKTIITGHEMKHRSWEGTVRKIVPQNADFWGNMLVPVDQDCRSVVINSTIFPKTLFEKGLFDECLRYGFEELDIARHAVSLGYRIDYQDCLYVNHYQSLIDRADNRKFVYASQLYTTAKAYLYYERSLPKTIAYVLLAPLQLAGSLVKRRDPQALKKTFQATATAYRYFFSKQNVQLKVPPETASAAASSKLKKQS